GAGRLAGAPLVAAADVVAAGDPVVVARAQPVHDLPAAAHGQRVAGAGLQQEALDAVQPVLRLVEVAGLLEEVVEIELGGRQAGGERQQRPARHKRIAVDERRCAVTGELGRARPFQEGVAQPRSGSPASSGKRPMPLMLSRMASAVRYSTWSDKMWPTSWASTVCSSCASSRLSSPESMTTIGLSAPIAIALVIGVFVT